MSDSDEHWISQEFRNVDLVSRTFLLCNAYIRRSSVTPMSEIGPGLARGMYEALIEWQATIRSADNYSEMQEVYISTEFIFCPKNKHLMIVTAKDVPCPFCEMTS
jgi:hypothetical protein